MSLAFGAVEDVFARLHGIREDKRVAFRARFKHLKRLGFPPGTNTGSGRAAAYEGPEIFLLALALELLQLGLSPERAVGLITKNMFPIATVARMSVLTPGMDLNFYLQFDPSALSGLAEEDDEDSPFADLWYSGTGTLNEMMEGRSWTRVAIINVPALIERTFWLVSQTSAEEAESGLLQLKAWLLTRPEYAQESDGNS